MMNIRPKFPSLFTTSPNTFQSRNFAHFHALSKPLRAPANYLTCRSSELETTCANGSPAKWLRLRIQKSNTTLTTDDGYKSTWFRWGGCYMRRVQKAYVYIYATGAIKCTNKKGVATSTRHSDTDRFNPSKEIGCKRGGTFGIGEGFLWTSDYNAGLLLLQFLITMLRACARLLLRTRDAKRSRVYRVRANLLRRRIAEWNFITRR